MFVYQKEKAICIVMDETRQLPAEQPDIVISSEDGVILVKVGDEVINVTEKLQ